MDQESIAKSLETHIAGKKLSQETIKLLADNGYVGMVDVAHLGSPNSEYEITFLTDKARKLLGSRKK
jgi:hypothetical protein